MQYRKLGNSDLNVSEISLGSWLTYGAGVNKSHGVDCVKAAFEAGINFIDTANIYGRGAAETFLGDVLSSMNRKSYILATKLFFPMTDSDRGLSAAQIKKQLDLSLQRLKTDYIDLYQCHRWDASTPIAETMEALTSAVKSGKVRYIGFSEWTAAQAQAAADVPGSVKFVSSQPQYSMLWRAPEREIIPYSAKNGISQIVWSPLAQGVLTGKYKPGAAIPKDSRAANDAMNGFMGDELMNDTVLKAVQDLGPIAKDANLSIAQLALAWVLREPNVASAIVGASRPEQVAENAKAAGKKLSPETLSRIDSALAPALAA